MKTETKKPLYKVLNEQRTKGEWFEEYDNDEFGQFYSIFAGEGENVFRYPYRIVKDEEYKANAQYTALAVNNLHLLAEALEGVIRVADRKTDEFDKAKEALSKIS